MSGKTENTIVSLDALLGHVDLADLEAGWQDAVKSTFGEEADPVRTIAETPVAPLAKSLSVKRPVAAAIKATAEDLLPVVDDKTVQINMTGEANASATAGSGSAILDQNNPFGPYAQFLQPSASSALGGLGQVNPRINPDFVRAAATGVSTFVFLATGVDRVLFNEEFWRDADLEDMKVRKAIFQLTEKMKRGEFITQDSMKSMFDGIDDLLDEQFEQLVNVCADFAGTQEVLAMTHGGGQIDLSRFAGPMARMGILVPATAERISKQMRGSAMPEQSGAVSEMIAAMMNIMRNDKEYNFAQAVRAPSGLTADEVVVWFLEKRMGTGFGNRVSLGQSYERMLNLFAACPPILNGLQKTQYLLTVGSVTNEVGAFHALVDPQIKKEVEASKASGFQAPVAGLSTPAQSQAVARAWFSISLKISWGRK